MQSIHPKVQDFGDEGETNYETEEVNKENMNESCIFIADQKSENTKHTTKYQKQTLCKLCRKKSEKRKVKNVLFPRQNISKKEKWRINLQLLRIFN